MKGHVVHDNDQATFQVQNFYVSPEKTFSKPVKFVVMQVQFLLPLISGSVVTLSGHRQVNSRRIELLFLGTSFVKKIAKGYLKSIALTPIWIAWSEPNEGVLTHIRASFDTRFECRCQ